jgi:hypothetical protein
LNILLLPVAAVEERTVVVAAVLVDLERQLGFQYLQEILTQ